MLSPLQNYLGGGGDGRLAPCTPLFLRLCTVLKELNDGLTFDSHFQWHLASLLVLFPGVYSLPIPSAQDLRRSFVCAEVKITSLIMCFNIVALVTSKGCDQTAHKCRLIRAFACHLKTHFQPIREGWPS